MLGRLAASALVAFIVVAGVAVRGQDETIGIIDFYGLNRVSAGQAREALTFKEGDAIRMGGGERPASIATSEARLAKLANVARARITIVCCESGRVIAYVGIEEQGAPTLHVRAAPKGPARLAADIVQSGMEFSTALMQAAQRGEAGEDRSDGHAFAHDPATRAIQERFVTYAARDLPELRRVLATSSDASHRALAAQVLGYTRNKPTVVDDLVEAMRDPSEEVRNDAMRTLLVFAEATPRDGRSAPQVPAGPFIEFLHSLVWSDRNKASGALVALSATRDPALLETLRKDALRPLVEMARWKSAGHAFAPFLVLGRIAGYSDDALQALWDRGEREVVIAAARARRQPAPDAQPRKPDR